MFYRCTLYLNGIESASVRDEQIDWIVFVSKNKNCWEQLDVSLNLDVLQWAVGLLKRFEYVVSLNNEAE